MDEEIIKLYNQGYGIPSIAKKLNIYVSKVRNKLIKNGITIRNRAESQKLALSLGTSKHPTKGTIRSTDVKDKIGTTIAKGYENLTEDQKQKISDSHKEAWKSIPLEKRIEIQKKGSKGIRDAAKNGSKLEKIVVDTLEREGYRVIWHKKGDLASSQLETDILLPVENIAIEIDGISHFEPIWGAKILDRSQRADVRKNGLLMSKGYKVLRIKSNIKSFSKTKIKKIEQFIIDTINKVINSPDKLIEVEVS